MNDTVTRLAALGVRAPDVLLPKAGTDLSKWAVIACDQYSADPSYWEEVEKTVGSGLSSLHLIQPEAWLKSRPGAAKRIDAKMQSYLDAGVLDDRGEFLVFVRRETTGGVRRGLIVALDLEQYDWSEDAETLIRASEQTVVERLPARIEIRRDAAVEIPHILVLIDDKQDGVMGSLDSIKGDLEVLYDFDLMLGGGHITGYKVYDEVSLKLVAEELEFLLNSSSDKLLFAMGDGNHSFAAAKACWDEIKGTLSEKERENHPARYCLCELVNIYDPGLTVEPIHRALLGVDPEAVQREVGFDANNPPSLQDLQPRLDAWLANHPEAELEYIHGEEECRKLCEASDRLAVIFPEFDRESLFQIIRMDGVFVRKSFSLGHARDKRYYLEARQIR